MCSFTSYIYITLTWVLVQLNPDRPHPHSKLLATVHYPFSTSIAMKKKNPHQLFWPRENVLWQTLVLLPQAPSPSALPSARQQPKEQQPLHHISLSWSATPQPVHYNDYSSEIYSFPHLKCNSVLLVGFILAYSLLWIQDGTIAVLHECLLCRCKWVFNSSWFIIKNNTNTYKKITQKDIWQNSTGWVLSLVGFGGGFFWGEGCQF